MDRADNISVEKRDLVVTFINGHPKAALLLRSARKIAQDTHCQWKVVYIETPELQKQTALHYQVLSLLTRAKQMGAEIEHIQSLSLVKAAEDFLFRESEKLSLVIIGSTDNKNHVFSYMYVPQWVRLMRVASLYSKVEIIPLAGQLVQQPLHGRFITMIKAIEPRNIFYGSISVCVPLVIAMLLSWILPPVLFRINEQNIDNLFLIVAGIVAGRYGLIPGLISATEGFFLNNYYFVLPYNQIKLDGISDWFGMGLFLLTAVLISVFTGQMRDYTSKLRKREMHSEMLFSLYRIASESFTSEQAIETIQKNLANMLKADVVFFLPSLVKPTKLEAAIPKDTVFSELDKQALDICWKELKSTGAGSPYISSTKWRFEPMVSTTGEIGVLAARAHNTEYLDVWFGRLLSTAADLSASILAHIELENSMENTRVSQEREKLRIMLLSSVSHDLKTPLAGIIGSLSACQSLRSKLKPEQQQELLAGSLEEAQRLDSFITNILEMTRLETGNVKFRMDWHEIGIITTQVVQRMEYRLAQRKVKINLPEVSVEAYMDDIMVGQVLQNLLDNACKYTEFKTPIEINWRIEDSKILCQVRDYGAGIPEENLVSVFDKYARLYKKDTKVAGTGLGLAIAKAIIEAQNGWIKAENHPNGGAVIIFCLPKWRPYQVPELREENKNMVTK